MFMRMHIKFPPCDALTVAASEVEVEAFGEVDGLDGIREYRFLDSEVAQRSDEHVARTAGKAVKIKNSHEIFLCG
jgi:hypothetical protein